MCAPGQPPAPPASTGQALSALQDALGYLARVDAAALTAAEQADCLRGLEQAASAHTAARASVLAAFTAGGGCQDDGHASARTWLRWQTRVSAGAAGAAMGWMRRLAAHRAVAEALAGAVISASFARHLCDWTDLLPEEHRAGADAILLAAAAGGAELADLAALAGQIRRRTARPDADGDDGFAGRWVQLETTFGGAGRLNGGLSSGCAAALSAVLESLGKRAGPEDTRTKKQRDHDAVEEMCRRLIAAGCLPARAGQPTQVQLHMTLDQLRGLASAAEDAWASARASQPGWLDDPGAAAAACDATIVPVVSGHVDLAILDRLTAILLDSPPAAPPGPGRAGTPASGPGAAFGLAGPAEPGAAGFGAAQGQGGPGQVPGAAYGPGAGGPGAADGPGEARRLRTERAVRAIVLRAAADLLSGPGGLAGWLRTSQLDGAAASVSLPLDIGAATDTIPAHLRRAVTARDRRCRFPGCYQPSAACQPHHLIPRARGGPTSLTNLLNLCSFHHLIAVHRWGWGIALNPDGTVTATSPDRLRTLHSHSPPSQAA